MNIYAIVGEAELRELPIYDSIRLLKFLLSQHNPNNYCTKTGNELSTNRYAPDKSNTLLYTKEQTMFLGIRFNFAQPAMKKPLFDLIPLG